MKRPVPRWLDSCRRHDRPSRLHGSAASSSGYTLIEILVATTLSLLLLGAVARMFGTVGQSITDSRSMLESAEQLRLAQQRLQQDLAGFTVTMSPPRKPENNEGYFEYIEGPITAATAATYAVNTDNGNLPDTTVGDFDDILMFTTCSSGRPFVGRYGANTIQSDIAEVAWFIRGRTLYRRVLLVVPSAPLGAIVAPYYANCDISAHIAGGGPVANTLGDLTRRECRFAHRPDTFPYNISPWNWTLGALTMPNLPTLRECSYTGWTINAIGPPVAAGTLPTVDFWTNAGPRLTDYALIGTASTTSTQRIADDVILTNVIGFDVKAWDPGVPIMSDGSGNPLLPGNPAYAPNPTAAIGFGAYVDLGYYPGYSAAPPTYPQPQLSTVGMRVDRGVAGYLPRVYDTWSTHYESVSAPGLTGTAGRAINGFDDPGNDSTTGAVTAVDGIVDGADEAITSPPYPYPLRGIQVKIRVFEPDSRQVREVTVVQDFLPQ